MGKYKLTGNNSYFFVRLLEVCKHGLVFFSFFAGFVRIDAGSIESIDHGSIPSIIERMERSSIASILDHLHRLIIDT